MFYKQTFPPHETHIHALTKVSKVVEDVVNVKENFHLIHTADQNVKATDVNRGWQKLLQYGPKTDKNNIITGEVDKSSGASHCADSFRYLIRGVGVKHGRITNNFSQHGRVNIPRRAPQKSFQRTRLWTPRRSVGVDRYAHLR